MRMLSQWLLTALSLAIVACGDDDRRGSPAVDGGAWPESDGGAGKDDSGPDARVEDADADDGVRGAVSLHILSGPGCSLEEQYWDLPVVESEHPVTATEKGLTVEDGSVTSDEQPVAVLCNWLGAEAPYVLSAALSIGTEENRQRIGIETQLLPGDTAPGGAGFTGAGLPATYGSSQEDPCNYTVIELDEEARSVWGSFTCPTFGPSDATDSCEVGPSYFFFENCRKLGE